MEALSRTWAATIAAASHHTGAKKLGEQSVEASRLKGELAELMAKPYTAAQANARVLATGVVNDLLYPATVEEANELVREHLGAMRELAPEYFRGFVHAVADRKIETAGA